MPRLGLRVGKAQMEELNQEYQVARGRKDFDMTQGIQGMLPGK